MSETAPPLSEVPIQMLRMGRPAPEGFEPTPVAQVIDQNIPGPRGDIKIRIYRPHAETGLPVVLFMHGGGFILGDLDSHDEVARVITMKADCITIAVDYRLAPENPFPAAPEDCFAALRWAHENAAGLGGDPERIAVCGDSAGGNLAAVVAQMALDSREFNVALQLLIYPMTDQSRDYPSYERNASGYMLTTAALHWFMDNYIPDPEDRKDPMASPMLRPSLEGLPPALVISAEFDPLVDENEAYARRLREAGVPTEYVCFPGMIHPFFTLGGVVDDTARAEDLVAQAMRKLA
jgi:acetyl esterase